MQLPRLASLTLALTFVGAACGGKDEPPPPARQIDLAPAPTTPPKLADAPLPSAAPAKAPTKKAPAKQEPVPVAVTPTPAPVAPAPAPAPFVAPAPVPTTGAIANGSSLTLRPSARVCTNTHKAGDLFIASLANGLNGTNGAQIPAGSTAQFRIIESTKKVGTKDSLLITYELVSVKSGDETYEVTSHVAQSTPLVGVATQSTTDKATKIGAGAAIGAIAGRILGGGNKGTVLGGVAGAAAGAAVANNTKNWNGCLTETSEIVVMLDRPLTVRLAAKPQ